MDYLRSCYTCKMRFDAAGEKVGDVRWYFCPDGALEFPGPHRFASRNWRTDPKPVGGIGDTFDALPVWSNGKTPAWATGTGDPCGPLEWFANGVPSNAPNLIPTGIETCCGSATCQPWSECGFPAATIVTPGYDYQWTPLSFSPHQYYEWNSNIEPGATQFVAQLHDLCGTQPGLLLRIFLTAVGPNPLSLKFESYDATTYTGSYTLDPPESAVPGFYLLLCLPPA